MLLLGKERFEGVDIRVRVKGGGHVSRIYGELYSLFHSWEHKCWCSPMQQNCSLENPKSPSILICSHRKRMECGVIELVIHIFK